MELNWTYWCLIVSWVIMFGQAVFWFVKYLRLRRIFFNYQNFTKEVGVAPGIWVRGRKRYNDDGSYTGDKTTLLADMTIEAMVERHEREAQLMYSNLLLKTKEDKKQ